MLFKWPYIIAEWNDFCKTAIPRKMHLTVKMSIGILSILQLLRNISIFWEDRYVVKFIYSEKVTKFCEIFTLLCPIYRRYLVPLKSKVKIFQNIVPSQNIWSLYTYILKVAKSQKVFHFRPNKKNTESASRIVSMCKNQKSIHFSVHCFLIFGH